MDYGRQNQGRKSRFSQAEPTSPSYTEKSREQIEFDLEFAKWEKGFSDWKLSYANHPDSMAYRQYERKFIEVRNKLMLKRAEIYQKTFLRSQLNHQFEAASKMADTILSKFGEPSLMSVMNQSQGNEQMQGSPFQQNQHFSPNLNFGYHNGNVPSVNSQIQNSGRFQVHNFNQHERDERLQWVNHRNQEYFQIDSQGNSKVTFKRSLNSSKKLSDNKARLAKLGKAVKTVAPAMNPKHDEDMIRLVEARMKRVTEMECPSRISGAARRRFNDLSSKDPATLTEYEKKFLTFGKMAIEKRAKYYENIKDGTFFKKTDETVEARTSSMGSEQGLELNSCQLPVSENISQLVLDADPSQPMITEASETFAEITNELKTNVKTEEDQQEISADIPDEKCEEHEA